MNVVNLWIKMGLEIAARVAKLPAVQVVIIFLTALFQIVEVMKATKPAAA